MNLLVLILHLLLIYDNNLKLHVLYLKVDSWSCILYVNVRYTQQHITKCNSYFVSFFLFFRFEFERNIIEVQKQNQRNKLLSSHIGEFKMCYNTSTTLKIRNCATYHEPHFEFPTKHPMV